MKTEKVLEKVPGDSERGPALRKRSKTVYGSTGRSMGGGIASYITATPLRVC